MSFRSDALRYLLAGGLNTVITFLLYQFLLSFFSSSISYVMSWTAGFLIVVIFYPDKVFTGGRANFLTRSLYAFMYITVFVFGLALLSFLASIGLSSRVSILLVLFATALLNLLFGRFLFRESSKDL